MMEIKFVSYDGKCPCLCLGTLVLNIDGEDYYFGVLHEEEDDHHFNYFWESGGKIWFSKDWKDHIVRRKWKLVVENLPDFLKPYGKKLIKVFNANVPYGCCGGCA